MTAGDPLTRTTCMAAGPPVRRRFAAVGLNPARTNEATRSGVRCRSSRRADPAPSETAVTSSVSNATKRSVRPDAAAVRNSSTTRRADTGSGAPPRRRSPATRARARWACCWLAASVMSRIAAISAWLYANASRRT